MTERYDVAVVGLGAMGSAALYQLAKRAAKVIGLDRFAPPHDRGSSHGESRITREGVGEGRDYVPFVQASHRIWRELEGDTGTTLFHQCGALVMGPGDGNTSHHGMADFTSRSIAAAEAGGVAHEVFDGAEAARRFPMFLGPKGDEKAYFEPSGGFVIPEACIAAQLQRAEALGAVIRTGITLREMTHDAAGVHLDTSDGPITADRVVMAVGAWSAPFLGAPFDRLLTVTRQLLHWFALDDMSAYGPGSPVYIWMFGKRDSDYFYGFPPFAGDPRIKVASEQYDTETTAATIDMAVDPAESDRMYRDKIAGRLAGVTPRVAKAAACLYTLTPDRRFIIDQHPDDERITVISACSGHGFKHSAGIGMAVAEQLSNGRSSIDLNPFALSRFG